MSTGRLKAQYNRVRTSAALHTTSIWSTTIGIEQEQAGTNQAIEASIFAPGGGGFSRAAKRQRAQELIEATGFQPAVRDFESLKALARRNGGNDAVTNRGACKICGGLGHLTKQCRNFLDNGRGGAGGAADALDGDGGGGGEGQRALLTAEDDEALLLQSGGSSGSESDSERSSDSGRRKRKKSSSKHKKEKSKKHKKEKSKKHKRERRERSRSRDRSRDRRRSRSRSR